MFWVEEIGYLFNVTILKASIMLLYGRIFETPGWRRAMQWFIIFSVCKTIAFLFPLVFQCKPIHAIWDPNAMGNCLNISAIGFAGAGFSITEDIIFLIIPIPTLWHLQLDRKKRLLLILLFSIGSL